MKILLQMRTVFLVTFICMSQILLAQSAEVLRPGKLLFQNQCARCHGIQGKGGTGPNLARSYLPRASTDRQLSNIISNGISGTGMPGAWILTEVEKSHIINYVRYLGKGNDEVIAGNSENGRTLFETSICSTCHIVGGEGGSLGPELTSIGLQRGQDYLVEAITHPGQSKPTDENGFYRYLTITITLKDGTIYEGLRINEDSFSIQIKDHQNNMYSFAKEEIATMDKKMGESLMPSFSDQLSKSDIVDISAYLTSLK